MPKIKVKVEGRHRDGGSVDYIDQQGNIYCVDGRISPDATKGVIYDQWPGNPNAKRLDGVELEIVESF